MKTTTKITMILGAAALLLLPLSGTARADETMRRLKTGEILIYSVTTGGTVKAGRTLSIINAKPAQVFKVISQAQHYHHFVPRMTESRRVGKGLYLLKSNLPWPAKDSWAKVKLVKGKRGNTYVLTWSMQQGTFKRFEGSAWIQPAGNGKSLLTYQLLAVPSTIAPDKLLSKAMRGVTDDMTEAIRDRAVALANGKMVAGQKVASSSSQ